MKLTLLIAAVVVIFSACKKDKFTTEPQISFKSISPNVFSSSGTNLQKDFAPKLTLKITDEEGDIGIVAGSDTARIYILNLNTSRVDSIDFPNLGQNTSKTINAEVTVNLFNFLGCKVGGPVRPRTDTTFFEVYVKDFAKHKSNVITTPDPVYYICE